MSGTIILVASLAVGSLLLLVFLAMGERKNRLDVRLNELAGRDGADAAPDGMAELARSALPRMGLPLLPKEGAERTRLKARLVHAGLYTRQAMVVFLGVKMILMVSPVLVGLAVGFVGLVPILYGLIGGMCVGIVGMIGPSFWLDRRKKRRQNSCHCVRATASAPTARSSSVSAGASFGEPDPSPTVTKVGSGGRGCCT
jgi:hypothetical protein